MDMQGCTCPLFWGFCWFADVKSISGVEAASCLSVEITNTHKGVKVSCGEVGFKEWKKRLEENSDPTKMYTFIKFSIIPIKSQIQMYPLRLCTSVHEFRNIPRSLRKWKQRCVQQFPHYSLPMARNCTDWCEFVTSMKINTKAALKSVMLYC